MMINPKPSGDRANVSLHVFKIFEPGRKRRTIGVEYAVSARTDRTFLIAMSWHGESQELTLTIRGESTAKARGKQRRLEYLVNAASSYYKVPEYGEAGGLYSEIPSDKKADLT